MKFSALILFALIFTVFMQAKDQPNIIVIYTDDQGFGDLTALNPEAKFKTPNLDLLAKE